MRNKKLKSTEEEFSADFWLKLRERLGYSGRCEGLCSKVSKDLLDNFASNKGYISSFDFDGHGLSGWSHVWLQKKVGQDTFIVDGTAGQYFNHSDPEFGEVHYGFYGSIEDAPKKLREIYNKGKLTKLIEGDNKYPTPQERHLV